MKRSLWAAAALCALAALAAPGIAQKGRKPAPAMKAAAPRPENQFVTVEEFVKARRAPRTTVSVEGYVVLGTRASDGVTLALTDSIDHVLNARDAAALAKQGAKAVAPATATRAHPRWAWTAKGLQRLVMYTGAGKTPKALHDTVAKTRVTGQTAAGRATLRPVTKIEYQDENGDWKAL